MPYLEEERIEQALDDILVPILGSDSGYVDQRRRLLVEYVFDCLASRRNRMVACNVRVGFWSLVCGGQERDKRFGRMSHSHM